MSFSQGKPSVVLDDILKKVGEFNILSHYLGISKVPCIINSPLRDDNNPSFGLYSLDGIKVRYKDLATNDSGDTFDILSKMWKLGFEETLDKIYEDVKYMDSEHDSISTLDSERSSRTYHYDTTLECKIRDWREHDIQYWKNQGISLPWLKFGEIYPISHKIITKDKNRYEIPAEKHAYAYVERKDGEVSLKLYQPFSDTFKWSNKHDSSVWDLWEQLPENGDYLIITSSRKDALCIWENVGIPAVSLQAESNFPKEHVVQQLKDRFKNIFILYDNDYDAEVNVGRVNAGKLAKKFNLLHIEIPNIYKSKDPSDLYKNYNKHTLKTVILQLMKDILKL